MASSHSELEGVRAISPETKQAAGGRRLWSLCGRLLQPRLSVRHRDFVIDRGRHAEFTQSVRGVTYLQLVQPQQLAIRAFDAVGVRRRVNAGEKLHRRPE